MSSSVLDVALGLIFVYWFFASLCSTAVEIFATRREERAKMLRASLHTLLGKLGEEVLKHPLVTPPEPGAQRSYIGSDVFASALLEVVKEAHQGSVPAGTAIEGVMQKLGAPKATSLVRGLLAGIDTDAERARLRVARWFDEVMEHASAGYRRKAQTWTLVVATLMTVAFDVDTVRIANTLWTTPVLTARITDAATSLAQHPPAKSDPDLAKRVVDAADLAKKLDLPVGWSADELGAFKDRDRALKKILGFVLSIIALRLGAPFWFDLLNRLTGLRRKPEATPK